MCTKSKKKDVEMKLDQIDLNIIEEPEEGQPFVDEGIRQKN